MYIVNCILSAKPFYTSADIITYIVPLSKFQVIVLD